MKAMYVGDHAVVTMYGVDFPQGVPVDVDEKVHATLAGKLRGNGHFLKIGEDGTMGAATGGTNGNVPVHTQPPTAPGQGGPAARNQSRRQ